MEANLQKYEIIFVIYMIHTLSRIRLSKNNLFLFGQDVYIIFMTANIKIVLMAYSNIMKCCLLTSNKFRTTD